MKLDVSLVNDLINRLEALDWDVDNELDGLENLGCRLRIKKIYAVWIDS